MRPDDPHRFWPSAPEEVCVFCGLRFGNRPKDRRVPRRVVKASTFLNAEVKACFELAESDRSLCSYCFVRATRSREEAEALGEECASLVEVRCGFRGPPMDDRSWSFSGERWDSQYITCPWTRDGLSCRTSRYDLAGWVGGSRLERCRTLPSQQVWVADDGGCDELAEAIEENAEAQAGK